MKLNFIYPVMIGVLLVLLFMSRCNRDKTVIPNCTAHSITIDSLKNIINEYADGKRDTTIIDTFIIDKIVHITKTIPKIVEVPVYIDNTDDSVRVYTYGSTKESVVATDTIEVKGQIVSHKQTIHITEPCPIIKETKLVPIVTTDTVKMTRLIPHRFQLKVGLSTDIHNLKNIKPTMSLVFKKFDLFTNHSITTNEWNVGLLVPIITLKAKNSTGVIIEKNKYIVSDKNTTD